MNGHPLQIEIKQDRPGFERFTGSWVCTGDINVVVDVGPACSAQRFIKALSDRGVTSVDYVLLSHIHIDHAGGLADFLEAFPTAKAVCHAKGLRFVVDPSKLWAGSLQVLGELAEYYGPPRPVASDRLIPHTEVDLEGLTVVETPGHAPHHLSYVWRDRLFAGEAAGNLFDVRGRLYLRPATPTRFFLPEAAASVDRLLALGDYPIYYAHFDHAESSRLMLARFREQLLRWRDIIRDEWTEEPAKDLIPRCVDALLRRDHEIAAFERMDAETQARERWFIGNSVKGYLGFLQENSETGRD